MRLHHKYLVPDIRARHRFFKLGGSEYYTRDPRLDPQRKLKIKVTAGEEGGWSGRGLVASKNPCKVADEETMEA